MFLKGVLDIYQTNKTRKSSRQKIRINPNVVISKPSKRTVDTIVNNSSSDIFDEAKSEWELKAIIGEDSEGFSNICSLCGNPHLKYDFVINNPLTQNELIVGSTCIVRFGILKGNVDVESGKAIIKNFEKNQRHYNVVRGLIKTVMGTCPDANDYKSFYESLKYILDYKNITNPTTDELGDICFGDKWSQHKQYLFKQDRLRQLWYDPLSVETLKPKAKKDKVYKEGTTMGYKSRQGKVYNPMAARTKK